MAGKPKKLATFVIWVVLICVFLLLYLNNSEPAAQPTNFNQFRSLAAAGRIAEVWLDDNRIVFQTHDSRKRMTTTGYLDKELIDKLNEEDVSIHSGTPRGDGIASGLATPLLIILAAVVAVIVGLRLLAKRRDGLFGGVLAMRKTPAVMIEDNRKVTFADVGGCEEAKRSLGDVIDFLKNPGRWIDAGARLPRGVLLEGPPGCGKTLLARAVAGETDAKFFLIAASEFVEMFVGVGAARVRDTFETALKSAPAIVFIDELDAVGRRRGSGLGSGHDEREQTLNQLLVSLDGFKSIDRLVVLAATNRAEILDKALLRPGRFDRILKLPELSREARLAVFRIHSRNKPLGADVSLSDLAEATPGFNGAQLETLVNEATLLAVRRGRDTSSETVEVLQNDFLAALESVRPDKSQFDKLDEVLIDAASQLAKPTGKAFVRMKLCDESVIEGEVLWVNSTFIKLRVADEESATIVSKRQIARLEALEGTEQAEALEIAGDPWANRLPEAM